MPLQARARHRSPAPVSGSLGRLGERIRKARGEAGLSQAQLGQPHFTRAYVSALELGKIRPAMKSLEFLAAKLGKQVSYFVEDEEQEHKRRERELRLVRAGQLISEGAARQAVEELSSLNNETLSLEDRLVVKRTLGRALIEAGEPAAAVAALSDAVRGYDVLGNHEQAARARGQLGAALIALMSYDEAEEHLGAALRATASGIVRDPLFRVHVLHNLGVSQYSRGNYQVALEHFERAAEEGQDVADQKWLASLYAAMGMSRRQVGDFDSAVNWLRKSEALFEALSNRTWVAEIRFQTARTLRSLGNRARAAERLAEAREAAVAAGNNALLIKIEVFTSQTQAEDGEVEAAIARAEGIVPIADASGDPRLRFIARFVLARSLAIADSPRAEVMLRDLVRSLSETDAASDLAQVHDELSLLLARHGRAEEALAFAQRAYAAGLKAKRGGV